MEYSSSQTYFTAMETHASWDHTVLPATQQRWHS